MGAQGAKLSEPSAFESRKAWLTLKVRLSLAAVNIMFCVVLELLSYECLLDDNLNFP